jgi:hypothetical protein
MQVLLDPSLVETEDFRVRNGKNFTASEPSNHGQMVSGEDKMMPRNVIQGSSVIMTKPVEAGSCA